MRIVRKRGLPVGIRRKRPYAVKLRSLIKCQWAKKDSICSKCPHGKPHSPIRIENGASECTSGFECPFSHPDSPDAVRCDRLPEKDASEARLREKVFDGTQKKIEVRRAEKRYREKLMRREKSQEVRVERKKADGTYIDPGARPIWGGNTAMYYIARWERGYKKVYGVKATSQYILYSVFDALTPGRSVDIKKALIEGAAKEAPATPNEKSENKVCDVASYMAMLNDRYGFIFDENPRAGKLYTTVTKPKEGYGKFYYCGKRGRLLSTTSIAETEKH